MHVILVTIGTDGDVFPYVGIGGVLLARGHRVTLVASEHYQALAGANGFGFHALVSTRENDELFGHPDFWNPWKTAFLCARWGLRYLKRQFDLLNGIVTPDAVLVANPGVLAAAMAHEFSGAPFVSLVLQPGTIPSSLAPPIMPGVEFLRRAPRPVWRVFWRALDAFGYVLMGRELNRLRAGLRLRPIRRIFQNWLSPQLALGLFPEWYARPQADWPPQLCLTGFPMFDGKTDDLPLPLLEFIRAGEPPVAFTFGTGMAHPGNMFRAALDACGILGIRGIFLTKFRGQLPESLPPSIHQCAFASFQKLFPLCAAVVHHGGVGTVAKALAAGCPQLIRPICFDQTDNGERVRQLGAGAWLKPGHRNAAGIAEVLRGLVTPAARSRCRELALRFNENRGLENTARAIEDLAGA